MSNSQSGLPADDPLGSAAVASLLPSRPRKAAARGRRGVLIAVAAVVVLLVVVGIWLMNRGKTAAVAAATLTRDPDPPITAPPAREAIHPGPDEFPAAGSSLAASLEIIKRAAPNLGGFENAPPANPRVARWEVRFPPGATVETYGHQLDTLGIELGVIGGGDSIAYAGNFAKQQPDRHVGLGSDERRAYLVWRSGALANLDSALLARVRVPTSGRLVVHFLPSQLETDLMAEERDFAAPRNVSKVRRTAFALVPDGDGFKFLVAEQEYFSGEVKKYNPAPPPGAKPKAATKAPAAQLP